jgi:hypothetical protein
MRDLQMPDLLFGTPPGLVLSSLALANIVLSLAIYFRFRDRHPEAWRKEVRHPTTPFWIHPVDQTRLLMFWLVGDYKALGDPTLTRLCAALKIIWILILPVMAWCGFTWSRMLR